MKTLKNLVLILILIISLLQAGHAVGASYTPAEKERIAQYLIDKKDFVGLFKNAKKIGYLNENHVLVISDAAFRYIKGCCNTEKDIIRLLEKNDFEVYLDKTEDKKTKEVIGEKHVSGFLLTAWTYQIYFDFENEKLIDVRAYAILDVL